MPRETHQLALLKDAKFLLSLRQELDAEEQRLATARMALAREQLETEHVSVPADEFRTWLEATTDGEGAER